jgi:hypothetical protein
MAHGGSNIFKMRCIALVHEHLTGLNVQPEGLTPLREAQPYQSTEYPLNVELEAAVEFARTIERLFGLDSRTKDYIAALDAPINSVLNFIPGLGQVLPVLKQLKNNTDR